MVNTPENNRAGRGDVIGRLSVAADHGTQFASVILVGSNPSQLTKQKQLTKRGRDERQISATQSLGIRVPTSAIEARADGLRQMHQLAARLIRAAACGDYVDILAVKEMLFDGVDEETFNAIVEQGRAITE